jgi:hypothetical protein
MKARSHSLVITLCLVIQLTLSFSSHRVRADPVAVVTLSDDSDAFTLANGIVTGRISKASGGLLSLKYRGLEMLARNGRHASGYW